MRQWTDLSRGLAELRRVTVGPVVILTHDPARLPRFWLNRYAPEPIAVEVRRDPPLPKLIEGLGSPARVVQVPIPLHYEISREGPVTGRPGGQASRGGVSQNPYVEGFSPPCRTNQNSGWEPWHQSSVNGGASQRDQGRRITVGCRL